MRWLLCLGLFLLAEPIRAQQPPMSGGLTPQEEAAGWTMVFDGSDSKNLLIRGDSKIVGDVLEVGGPNGASVRTLGWLGQNFVMRFRYRVVGPTVPTLRIELKSAFSRAMTGLSLPQLPGRKEDWYDLEIQGVADPTSVVMSFNLQCRLADGREVPTNGVNLGIEPGNPSIAFDVPPGVTLQLQNIRAKPDWASRPSIWKSPWTLLILLTSLAVALLIARIIWRSRRRQAAPSIHEPVALPPGPHP